MNTEIQSREKERRSVRRDEMKSEPSLPLVGLNYRKIFTQSRRTILRIGFVFLAAAFLIQFVWNPTPPSVFRGLGTILLLAGSACLAFYVFCPIRVPCSNTECGSRISSDAVWMCGTCQTTNQRTLFHSFLVECGNCGASPKVLFCPNCVSAIFLSGERAEKPYAFFANGKGDPAERASRHEQQLRTERERLETEELRKAQNEKTTKKQVRVEIIEDLDFDTNHDRHLTERLKARMEYLDVADVYKSRTEQAVAPKPTEEERLRNDLARERKRYLAAEEIAEEARREGDEKHKDNADLREKNRKCVDGWLQKQMT